MTPYEAAVNEASAKLALEDLSLLIERDVLYEQAKETVRNDTTFTFKKTKSRSTLCTERDEDKPTKRKYTTDSFRKSILVTSWRILMESKKKFRFKMLHQSKAPNSKDWETCEKNFREK